MNKVGAKVEKHTESKEEALKNMRKMVEAATEENEQAEPKKEETKKKEVKKVAEPLSITIEKAKQDISTAVIMTERKYGLHSSITVLVLEAALANVRAGNAAVMAMEVEEYKRELLGNE